MTDREIKRAWQALMVVSAALIGVSVALIWLALCGVDLCIPLLGLE